MYARKHTPRQWKELKMVWNSFQHKPNKIVSMLHRTPLQAPNSPLVEKQLAIYAEFWQNQKGGMHSVFKKKKTKHQYSWFHQV